MSITTGIESSNSFSGADPIEGAHEPDGDSYIDPVTGFMVFTARYLARRGFCCGNGCRHCPYDPPHRSGNPKKSGFK
jgi:hypothetical protein